MVLSLCMSYLQHNMEEGFCYCGDEHTGLLQQNGYIWAKFATTL